MFSITLSLRSLLLNKIISINYNYYQLILTADVAVPRYRRVSIEKVLKSLEVLSEQKEKFVFLRKCLKIKIKK